MNPEKPDTISILLFAREENQTSLVSIGEVRVPIKWLSEVEHFPKKISVENGIESIEVNLVGRGIAISELASELAVSFDSRRLGISEFAVAKLSPKWLRVSLDRSMLEKESDCKKVLLIELPSREWRFSVDIEFPQIRIGKQNEE